MLGDSSQLSIARPSGIMQYSNSAAARGVQGLPGSNQAVQYSQYGADSRQYSGMPPVGQSQLGQSSYGRFGAQSLQGQHLSQSQQSMVPYGGSSQMVHAHHSLQPHSMNTLSGPVNPPAFYPDLSASRIGTQGAQPQQQGQLMQQQQNGQLQQSSQAQPQNQQQVSQSAPQNQNQSNEPLSKEDRELFTPLQEARSAVEGMLRDDEMAIPTMDGLLSSRSAPLMINLILPSSYSNQSFRNIRSAVRGRGRAFQAGKKTQLTGSTVCRD